MKVTIMKVTITRAKQANTLWINNGDVVLLHNGAVCFIAQDEHGLYMHGYKDFRFNSNGEFAFAFDKPHGRPCIGTNAGFNVKEILGRGQSFFDAVVVNVVLPSS